MSKRIRLLAVMCGCLLCCCGARSNAARADSAADIENQNTYIPGSEKCTVNGKSVGRTTSVDGIALDTPRGAAIVCGNLTLLLDGIDQWPVGYSEEGAELYVYGTLQAVFDSRERSVRCVLQDPYWVPKDPELNLGIELPIPDEHRVTLPQRYAENRNKDRRDGSRVFVPDEAEVEEATDAVMNALTREWEKEPVDELGSMLKEDLKTVLRHLRYYYVQFSGMEKADGERYVVCNFFHSREFKNARYYWKDRDVEGKDVGAALWVMTYNLNTKETRILIS